MGNFAAFGRPRRWASSGYWGWSRLPASTALRGGSLSARLIGEVGYFGTTYTVLALAVPAMVVLLRRGDQMQRMLGLVYCAAGVTLTYALFLGTLEEQELYLLIVPSLLIIPVAVTLLRGARQGRRSAAGTRREMRRNAVIISALVFTLGINLATCVQWLRQPDDGFAQLLSVHGRTCPGWHSGHWRGHEPTAGCHTGRRRVCAGTHLHGRAMGNTG